MRPLGEQLMELLRVAPGETVCDLMCDGAALSTLLAVQGARVLAVDTRSDLTAAAAADVGGERVQQVWTDGRHLPIPDGSCDAVASLLTLVFGDAPSLLIESLRVLRPGGRLAVLTWDLDQSPPFLLALREALHEAGVESELLSSWLRPVEVDEPFKSHVIDDVARFDSLAQLWSAAAHDSDIGSELPELSSEIVRRIQRRLDADLSRYAG
ncbi:MAG TPA: class I SAM-dependent methyltransferase, partial [Candidatus Dormibacteraeota bacterium]|nr:class I SAM-dependent methyltransferase [Candidatus Dormibacteraeota bacterium]